MKLEQYIYNDDEERPENDTNTCGDEGGAGGVHSSGDAVYGSKAGVTAPECVHGERE